MTSARVSVPMVVGWFRPLILVPPSALLGLMPHQLELIISHELAHVRRLDYLFNWLQIVVETLLFYHPAVRAVSTRVREEREQALVLAEAETGPCQKITGTRICRSTRGYEDLAVSVVGETP